MLVEEQWQIRDLVLGPGTPYRLMSRTNPFRRSVRADQTGPRAWNHGSWSGAEFQAEAAVPLQVLIDTGEDDTGAWLAAFQQLAAAFRPVGAEAVDVQARFVMGGTEYLLFGRPRMVEPDLDLIGVGASFVDCAFVATDPLIYSGELHTTTDESGDPVPIGLPAFTGGLAAPVLLPMLVEQKRVGGIAQITNAGTAESGLRFRIDGPVPNPRVVLQRPDGQVQTLRWPAGLTVAPGQWVEVDTAAETAFLNGLVGSSVYPGFIDWPILPPGTSTLLFDAADRESGGLLTPWWRDAWY